MCADIHRSPPSTLHSSPKCTVATPVLHPPPQSPSNSGPWLPLLSAYQQYPPWHTHNKGQNFLEIVWAGFRTWESMCNVFWKSSKSAKFLFCIFAHSHLGKGLERWDLTGKELNGNKQYANYFKNWGVLDCFDYLFHMLKLITLCKGWDDKDVQI